MTATPDDAAFVDSDTPSSMPRQRLRRAILVFHAIFLSADAAFTACDFRHRPAITLYVFDAPEA